MSKKKKVLIIVILIGIFLVVGLIIRSINRKEYTLNLPLLSDIASINIEQNKEGILISNESDINTIYQILTNEERITKLKSKQEYKKGEDVIKIDLNYESSVAFTAFLFKKNDSYYLEQVGNGVYNIKEESFRKIEEFIEEH